MSEAIYDELTGLMTPFLFYESARQLQSWADRKGQPLTLISISAPEMEDDTLVECARKLNQELRGGDLLTRMGERRFLLLLLGDAQGAGHVIFRLSNTVKPRMIYEMTIVSARENLVSAMERLDI